MKNKELLSIIVPVYNVEKYLSKCIDSILSQTYIDFELILVNDGSNDKSAYICDQYANRDNRIKVIHKSNEGVRAAIRAAISISSGEYIGFVDSDDWIENNMYDILMSYIHKYDADCVICKYRTVDEKTGEQVESAKIEERLYVGEKDIRYLCKLSERKLNGEGCLSLSRCNKVFKREIIVPVLFNSDNSIIHVEDIAIVYPAMASCKKIYCIDKTLYNYRKGIISVTSRFKEEYFDDVWKMAEALSAYKDFMGVTNFNAWIFYECLNSIVMAYNSNMPFFYKRKKLISFFSDSRMKELLNNVSSVPMIKSNRFIYLVIKFKMFAVGFVFVKIKKKSK